MMNVGLFSDQPCAERTTELDKANREPTPDILRRLPRVLFNRVFEFVDQRALYRCQSWSRGYRVLSLGILTEPQPFLAHPKEIAAYERPEFRRHHFERENKDADYEVPGSSGKSCEVRAEEPQLDPSKTHVDLFKHGKLVGQCGKIALLLGHRQVQQEGRYSVEHTVSLVNCETGIATRSIKKTSDIVVIALSEQRYVIATSGQLAELALWDINQPNPIQSLFIPRVSTVGAIGEQFPILHRARKINNFLLIIGAMSKIETFIKCYTFGEPAGKKDAEKKSQMELKETANLNFMNNALIDPLVIRVLKDRIFTITKHEVCRYDLQLDGTIKKIWGLNSATPKTPAEKLMSEFRSITPHSVAVSEQYVAIQFEGWPGSNIIILESTTGKVARSRVNTPFFSQMWLRGSYLIGLQENRKFVLIRDDKANVGLLPALRLEPKTLHVLSVRSHRHFYVADFELLRELRSPEELIQQIWVARNQLVISINEHESLREKMFRLHIADAEREVKERPPAMPQPKQRPVAPPQIFTLG